MYYILEDEIYKVELEIGSTDIFDYMGESIFLDEDGMLQEYTIDDTFITEHDWFADIDYFDKIDAYRKGTYGKWKLAIDNWEDDYVGEFSSDEAFAQYLYADMPEHPLNRYIDWELVARDEMHSYFEEDGFYFRA